MLAPTTVSDSDSDAYEREHDSSLYIIVVVDVVYTTTDEMAGGCS